MIEANNQHIPRSVGWGIKRQNDLALAEALHWREGELGLRGPVQNRELLSIQHGARRLLLRGSILPESDSEGHYRFRGFLGAERGTRTPKRFLPLAPQGNFGAFAELCSVQ
jgi:hypothetical protein